MEMLQAAFLGLIQGLTEFIPVSSSGHLIVARELFHLPTEGGLAFDAVLQLATVLAVVAYFARELPMIFRDKKLLFALVIGTIPAIVTGFLLESKMETVFRSAHLVAWTMLIGAGLMYAAEKYAQTGKEINAKRGLVIGLFQSLALVPGISRSGATISGGLFSGLSREDATRFSFLLSVPIIAGTGLKKLLDLGGSGALSEMGGSLLLASVVAFVSGFFAIRFLMHYLKHNSLMPFIWYRVALAGAILVFV